MRLVSTPLAAPVGLPSPRPCGADARLFEAVVAPRAVAGLLERLREPGAVAVTTGQQPGLFTGPLYTVFKALSAAALARELETVWQRPVVPVFWLATDDHDFAESNHAAWLASDGTLRECVLRERPADAPMLPMYREPLGPEVECAGPLDEPRSQPASTKTATTRAVAVDRALRTVGVLRLRCTEAPCGGCRPGTRAVPAAWVMEGCPGCRRPVSRRANRGRRPRRCAVGDERSSRPVRRRGAGCRRRTTGPSRNRRPSGRCR